MGMEFFQFVFFFFFLVSSGFSGNTGIGLTEARTECLDYFEACDCTSERKIVCTKENSVDYHLTYLQNSPYFEKASLIELGYSVSFENLVFLCESKFLGRVVGVGAEECEQLEQCGVRCMTEEREKGKSGGQIEENRSVGRGEGATVVIREESKYWVFGVIALAIILLLVFTFCGVCCVYLRGWAYCKRQYKLRKQASQFSYFLQCD